MLMKTCLSGFCLHCTYQKFLKKYSFTSADKASPLGVVLLKIQSLPGVGPCFALHCILRMKSRTDSRLRNMHMLCRIDDSYIFEMEGVKAGRLRQGSLVDKTEGKKNTKYCSAQDSIVNQHLLDSRTYRHSCFCDNQSLTLSFSSW